MYLLKILPILGEMVYLLGAKLVPKGSYAPRILIGKEVQNSFKERQQKWVWQLIKPLYLLPNMEVKVTFLCL